MPAYTAQFTTCEVGQLDSGPDAELGRSTILSEYKALITAGGIGTRLLPFSKEIPKEMFPIITHDGNNSVQLKPVVQAIFEQFHTVGIRSFYFVVGRGKRAIEDHFCTDPGFLRYLEIKGKLPRSLSSFYDRVRSSNLAFLNQIEPLGFGDAVLQGRPLIKGDFIVQAGDTFILSEEEGHLGRLATMHRKYRASATILLQQVPDPRHYGVVEGSYLEDGTLRISSAVEKPETPKSNYAIMPVYIFSDTIFEALSRTEPGCDGELQLTDAIQRLILEGKPVVGVNLRTDELRLDLGSPETMIEALKLSLERLDVEDKQKLEPGNTVGENVEPGLPKVSVGSEAVRDSDQSLTQVIPVRKKERKP